MRIVREGPLSTLYVEDQRHAMKPSFLTDETYSQVLDNAIIVCTDAAIVNQQGRTIFLAKRRAKPMPGWWWIGGRRKAGESPIQGMLRNFKRETTLDLPAERFKPVAICEYHWKDREQAPQENGSHNLAHTYAVELLAVELETARRNLEAKEYRAGEGLREFSYDELVAQDAWPENPDGIHPVIIDFCDRVFW